MRISHLLEPFVMSFCFNRYGSCQSKKKAMKGRAIRTWLRQWDKIQLQGQHRLWPWQKQCSEKDLYTIQKTIYYSCYKAQFVELWDETSNMIIAYNMNANKSTIHYVWIRRILVLFEFISLFPPNLLKFKHQVNCSL